MIMNKETNWFKKINFPIHKEVSDFAFNYCNSAKEDEWVYEPWQAPGTRSIFIDMPDNLHNKIKNTVNLPLHKEWYLWDFMDAKDLLIHKDSNSTGNYRPAAFIISIEGSFQNNIYSDDDLVNPIDSIIYGTGDSLLLYNSKYYHGGTVLSSTRKTLSCWVEKYE